MAAEDGNDSNLWFSVGYQWLADLNGANRMRTRRLFMDFRVSSFGDSGK
jgi:hypothetical protein